METPYKDEDKYLILNNFPFSSATKRMGIVLKSEKTGVITFILKGADTVMKRKVANLNECEFIQE